MTRKSSSITAGPADGEDYYLTTESALAAPLFLDVLRNDKKGTLYSLDDKDSADLFAPDSVLVPEKSRLGASIWITADGRVGYAMDGASAQSLAAGEVVHDSFLYASRRPNGSLVWSTVHVVVLGENDAPVAFADAAEVPEGALSTGSVAANDVDVDHGSVLSFTLAGAAPAGFALASEGSWAFDGSDPAWEALAAGETVEIPIPYIVADEHGAASQGVLTLTIAGRNDAPVAQADAASAIEDGSVSGSVAANDTDVDHGAILGFALTGTAPAGFVMASDGSWTLDTSGPDWQSLAVGETVQLLVPYSIIDEHGAASGSVLNLAVSGSNDGPVARADFASVEEDKVAAGSVASNDSDPDHGAALVYAPAGPLPAGFFMAPDGSWTFDASGREYQALGAGETRQLFIPYSVTDEHGAAGNSWLLLEVTGANDAPVVMAAQQGGFMVEDGPPTTGQIRFDDSDILDVHAVSVVRLSGGPGFGTVVIDGLQTHEGSATRLLDWHYAPGPGLQALEQGQQALEQYAITLSDGHGGTATQIVFVGIIGSGDSPVAAPASSMVLEDTILNGSLAPFASDPDFFSILTFSAGTLPAGFTLAANGSWTFDARHAAYQPLNGGQSLNVVVPYIVTDQTGRTSSSTLTVTVFGANEAVATAPPPVFTGSGDPNDFDSLTGGIANNAATISASPAGGTVTGGLAAQTIIGSDNFDIVYGGGGNDSINGRGGGDRLYGQAGADILDAGWGTDILYGGSGDDILRGQTPQAEATSGLWPITLYGGSGNDILIGGGNNDILIGGYGADTLTGGGLIDTFVFNSTLDTGDRITDFLYGAEKLDFRGIDANIALAGDQAFLWSHSGAAANSLWAVAQGTDTIIFGDTDGNLATAEFMLTLQNVIWIEPAATPAGFLL